MSGGERYALELCTNLSGFGYDVRVITTSLGVRVARRHGYDLQFVAVDGQSAGAGAARNAYIGRLARALFAAARVGHADVAFASSAYFYDLIPAAVMALTGRARRLVVPVFHLIPPPWKRDGQALRNALAWLEQRAMCLVVAGIADVVIVDNAELPEMLVRRGVRRSRIFQSAMGVKGAETWPPAESYDAIYVGRITLAKGIVDLLDAWQAAVSGRDWRLALVGNVEPGLDLDSLLRDRGLSEASVVHLSGRDDATVRALLGSARIFVTASREEGFGLAVLEALASGTPCVTYALPAFREAFPFGRREVPIGDVAMLAVAIVRLLECDADRESLKEVIRARFAVASWNEVAGGVARRLAAAAM